MGKKALAIQEAKEAYVKKEMVNFEKVIYPKSGSQLLEFAKETFGEELEYSPKSKKSILKKLREIARLHYFEQAGEAKETVDNLEGLDVSHGADSGFPGYDHKLPEEELVELVKGDSVMVKRSPTPEELSRVSYAWREIDGLIGRWGVIEMIDFGSKDSSALVFFSDGPRSELWIPTCILTTDENEAIDFQVVSEENSIQKELSEEEAGLGSIIVKGDTVMIMRELLELEEKNWINKWLPSMNDCVGKTGVVEKIMMEYDSIIVRIEGHGNFAFPPIVVERIEEEKVLTESDLTEEDKTYVDPLLKSETEKHQECKSEKEIRPADFPKSPSTMKTASNPKKGYTNAIHIKFNDKYDLVEKVLIITGCMFRCNYFTSDRRAQRRAMKALLANGFTEVALESTY